MERERIYASAEDCNFKMDKLGERVKIIVDVVNKNSEGTGNSDVDSIVTILGQHLASLQWIDSNTTAMASTIKDIERKMENGRHLH